MQKGTLRIDSESEDDCTQADMAVYRRLGKQAPGHVQLDPGRSTSGSRDIYVAKLCAYNRGSVHSDDIHVAVWPVELLAFHDGFTFESQ